MLASLPDVTAFFHLDYALMLNLGLLSLLLVQLGSCLICVLPESFAALVWTLHTWARKIVI